MKQRSSQIYMHTMLCQKWRREQYPKKRYLVLASQLGSFPEIRVSLFPRIIFLAPSLSPLSPIFTLFSSVGLPLSVQWHSPSLSVAELKTRRQWETRPRSERSQWGKCNPQHGKMHPVTYSFCCLWRTDPWELKTGSLMGVVQCRKNLGDISVPAA